VTPVWNVAAWSALHVVTGQVPVQCVHVVDEEIDADGGVGGQPGGTGGEQRDGARAGDREDGGDGHDLREVLIRPGRLHAGDALVTPGQAGMPPPMLAVRT
jgi:hypothetical protein